MDGELSSEQMENAMEKVEAERLIKEREGQNQRNRADVLDHQSFKKPIRDALLRIERERVKLTPEDVPELDAPRFFELVRMPWGEWKYFHEVYNDDDLRDQLYSNAIPDAHPEELADTIIGHLDSVVNQNVATGKLDSHDIEAIGKYSEKTLWTYLMDKRDYFGLTPKDCKYIVQSVVRPNVKAVLGKSKGGGFVRQFLSSMKIIGRFDEDSESEDGVEKLKKSFT